MRFFKLIPVFVAVCLSSCTQKKELPSSQWYKGNLHTHSYWSDGDEFPEVIMDWYKSNGYQFVALSDHNTLARGDKWKRLRKDSLYQNAFQNYLNTYGTDWVKYRLDSLGSTWVKLKTYDEYKPLFEEHEKFLILRAEEISDHFESKPLHMGAINVQEEIAPQGGNSVLEVLQYNLNAVLKQREESGVPMIAHVNHPNYQYAVSLEDMIALQNERFFEVYNGHHLVRNLGDSAHLSTEQMWDRINRAYVVQNKPLIYGLATDDSHNYHRKGRRWSNSGRGWIVVRADSLHSHAIIDAMESGDFYASTGVSLSKVDVTNTHYHVAVEAEPDVSYEIEFIGCKAGKQEAEVLKKVTATEAIFEYTDDLLFVRCRVTSTKPHPNPIEELMYQMAWLQPVLVSRSK
ncbi:CehA/McbA family metallohydrolase domain-containing protein [Marinoscillum furvescens]|uniref:Histidinol-phosphatase n=1 Tax=Marinoscillum furvescens DSM 4134 TaxID=1122208 RepID=A0A3D9KWU5_MARFU|nr:histidinol-phosphatase [Marinoscillum furvescens]RED91779.1 hypothetical protein C7460_13614 [Marinoscillum furvescens DSM 4134]